MWLEIQEEKNTRKARNKKKMSIRASFRASDHLSMLLEHKNNLEHFGESTKPLMSLVYLHLFAVNLGASARCLEIVHSISNGTVHGYL